MQLKISNLCKTYRNGTRALSDVSLTVTEGMFGLLGPNGAGKSTLMRTLATLQEADQGGAELDGIDVLKEKDSVRRRLGYLPQEFGLDPKVTAIDMLDHFAALKGIRSKTERTSAVESLLRQTNLWDSRHKRLGTFSSGMKQRFGIAQALLGDPQLLIVDEPTAGLDPEERSRFLNLLAGIGQSIIVILSTHIVDDVNQLCTDMAILNRGTVLLQESPQGATGRLEGKVWEKEVPRSELEQTLTEYKVISTKLIGGTHRVRVFAESMPGPGFSAVAATLDDVYFLTVRG
ncbi:MAG: ABC transporter ATP-binding protein [Acidobacteria bacterium]|nr:MAG: ABC transporter ATP-binding protein [Acidobacteriota bacterium]